MAEYQTKRLSELEESKDYENLYTLGYKVENGANKSYKVPLSDISENANNALQIATESSQTANSALQTSNSISQTVNTINGDLAQKSSMFTGAIMGKGCFYSTGEQLLFPGDRTIRVVFKTTTDISSAQQIFRTTRSNGGMNAVISNKKLTIRVSGSRYQFNVESSMLYELIMVKDKDTGSCILNAFKPSVSGPITTIDDPTMFLIGADNNSGVYKFSGTIISAQLFNFSFSDEDAAASWNGGHPELWRVPDAWRKEDSSKRVVVDLIPASLTPTVWKDISGQGNDIPYVPFDSNPAECEMAYENMGFPDTIIGTSAPNTAPNFIGQEYLDATAKTTYKAFGTSSAADWILQ